MTNGQCDQRAVRLGIVGLGSMGSAHARAIADGKIAGLLLAAVCDIDKSRRTWAQENLTDVPFFEDYRQMLSSGLLDAVLIATPHYLHPPIAVEAFGEGLHVLTEKPAGVRVSDVLGMNHAAEKSGKSFGIMFNQRTNPLYAQARDLVRQGTLGTIKRACWVVTNWYRTQAYYDSGDWRATWAGEGGGVLINQAPHNLDLWQWICGMPQSIYAHCAEGHYHQIEVEDDCTIFAVYPNGATASFITATGENPGTNRLEIIGDSGKIVLEDHTLKLWQLQCSERKVCAQADRDMSENIPASYREFSTDAVDCGCEHIRILQNFTDHILHGAELIAPGADGLYALSISNAAYLSAWENRTVSLPLSPADLASFDAHLARKIAQSAYRKKESFKERTEGGAYQTRWLRHW